MLRSAMQLILSMHSPKLHVGFQGIQEGLQVLQRACHRRQLRMQGRI
jgi:hypothetical protein